jgi:outer membrane protein assembly factor BamD
LQPATIRAHALIVACSLFAVAGCGYKERAAEDLQPDRIYEKGHTLLLGGDYRGAVRYYEALEARYPFSEEARQARLDIIYAYYRAGEQESAIDAADQFIRENPTHPRVDYAMYLRGLVYFERAPNFLERWFNTDLTERPPQDVRRSFDAFDQLIKQMPNSAYAHDARQRMIYLRNRLAEYEIHVAQHYLRSQAYVAAISRARFCIENYDGAPAVQQALEIMIDSYQGLGMDELAERSRDVFALNFPDAQPVSQNRRWWWPD